MNVDIQAVHYSIIYTTTHGIIRHSSIYPTPFRRQRYGVAQDHGALSYFTLLMISHCLIHMMNTSVWYKKTFCILPGV